jgi:iron complex transport system substrate-binding protein
VNPRLVRRLRLPLCLALAGAVLAAGGTRRVTDLAGRQVELPDRVTRVACLAGTSYEKVLLLGQGAKVVLAAPSNRLWAERVDPHRPEYTAMAHTQVPNLEDLLRRDLDVIFYRNSPPQLERMSGLGLKPLVSLAFGGQRSRRVETPEAFTRIVEDEVRLYGEALGGDAPRAAADWIAYYEARIKFVGDRVRDIPLAQRPRVYGVMGPSSTQSYGQYENAPWYVELAGGRMVTRELTEGGGVSVSMEQILRWNPDMVFIGHSYLADSVSSYGLRVVTGDPRWQGVRAVQAGHVFGLPVGVDYWDRDSEGVLLMEYFAKQFYPDRFRDLDLAAEVRDYYARFYRCHLSPDEVAAILDGRVTGIQEAQRGDREARFRGRPLGLGLVLASLLAVLGLGSRRRRRLCA